MAATTVIDKRGDVILHVGADQETSVKLLVSSRVLGLASSVFEAMFDGQFAEGQNLSSTSPPTIPFPGDDPKAMLTLCKLAHLQTADMSAELDVDTLVDFAVLCDKYSCANAVRIWSRFCISQCQCLNDPNVPGLEKLLFVSYALDLPDEFRQVTQGLIRHRIRVEKKDFVVQGVDYLPGTLIEWIQQEQRGLRSEAKAAIIPTNVMVCLRHTCHSPQNFALCFFRSLSEAGLFPIQTLSLAEYCKRAAVFAVAGLEDWGCCDGFSCICSEATNDKVMASVYEEINNLMKSTKGHCLDCLHNEVNGGGLSCRVPHP